MAIVREQFAANGAAGSAPTVSLGSTPGNGNTLIAVVSRNTLTGTPVVDSIVQTDVTWTRRYRDVHSSFTQLQMEVWTGVVTSGSAGTLITFNKNESSNLSMIVAEYSGVAATRFIDGISTIYGSGTSPILSPIGETSNTNDAAFLGCFTSARGDNAYSAPDNGFSIVSHISSGGSGTSFCRGCLTENILNGSQSNIFHSISVPFSEEFLGCLIVLSEDSAPISREQVNSFRNSGSGNITGASLVKTPTVGNTLVATLSQTDPLLPRIATTIDQTGVEWSKAVDSVNSSGGDPKVEIWVGRVVSASSDTFNVYLDDVVEDLAIAIMEYDGVESIGSYFAGSDSAQNTGTSHGVGSITSSVNGDVLFVGGLALDDTAIPIGASDSFNVVSSKPAFQFGFQSTIIYIDRLVNFPGSPSSITSTINITSSENGAGALLALSASPADDGARRQHGTEVVTSNTSSDQTVSLPSAPLQGSTLVLMVGLENCSGDVTIDTSTGLGSVGSWSETIDTGVDTNSRSFIFTLENAPSTAEQSITVNIDNGLSSAWPGSLCLVEYTGRAETSVAQTQFDSDNSTNPNTGTTSPSTGNPNVIHVGLVSQQRTDQGFSAPIGASPIAHISTNPVGGATGQTTTFVDKFEPNTGVQAFAEVDSSAIDGWSGGIIILLTEPTEIDTTHTTDALVVLESEITHDTDALLQAELDLNHNTDSLLQGEDSISHSSDSFFKDEVDTTHMTDMLIRPPERDPILRDNLIRKVPVSLRSGQFDVKILGIHGNGLAPKKFIYTLPPQEFILAKSNLFQIDIVDSIVKKDFVSTELQEELEPAGIIPLDNLLFNGFPSIFTPNAQESEEFVDGWTDYAEMSDDPIEEGFEEAEVPWNDPAGDGWTIGEIDPETNLSPLFLEFSVASNPGTGVKDNEDISSFFTPNPASLVQVTGNFKDTGDPNPHNITLPAAPTPGNILVVIASGGSTHPTNIVSSGTTWDLVNTSGGSGNAGMAIGYDVQAGASASIDITMNVGNGYGSFIVAEYSGLVSDVNVLGTDVSNSSSLTTISIPTTAPLPPTQLWLAAIGTGRFNAVIDNFQYGFSEVLNQPGFSGSPLSGTRAVLTSNPHDVGSIKGNFEADIDQSVGWTVIFRTLNVV